MEEKVSDVHNNRVLCCEVDAGIDQHGRVVIYEAQPLVQKFSVLYADKLSSAINYKSEVNSHLREHYFAKLAKQLGYIKNQTMSFYDCNNFISKVDTRRLLNHTAPEANPAHIILNPKQNRETTYQQIMDFCNMYLILILIQNTI